MSNWNIKLKKVPKFIFSISINIYNNFIILLFKGFIIDQVIIYNYCLLFYYLKTYYLTIKVILIEVILEAIKIIIYLFFLVKFDFLLYTFNH